MMIPITSIRKRRTKVRSLTKQIIPFDTGARAGLRGVLALAAVLLVGMSAPPALSPAHAQQERKVSILTSPAGSGPYNAWAVFQTRAAENHPWLRPIAVETPGFNYNVKFLAEKPELWKNTVIGSGSVLEWAANTGLKPYYPEALPAAKDFRIIGVMGVTGVSFVTASASRPVSSRRTNGACTPA
jgi:hypothetical protein